MNLYYISFFFLIMYNSKSAADLATGRRHPLIISMIDEDAKFEERTVVEFLCVMRNPVWNPVFSWFVRDPLTKLKTFLNNTHQVSNGLPTDEKGQSKFLLPMRRDFEGMALVCHAGSSEVSYLLPTVAATLPIEKIRFGSSNIVQDDQFRLWCDVKSAPGIVKKVVFRTDDGFDLSTSNTTKGDGWTRYELVKNDTVKMDDLNGLPVQCVAVTTKNGSVGSRVAALKVHYFQFSEKNSSAQVVVKGSAVHISFRAHANPFAMEKNIFVAQKLPSGVTKIDAKTIVVTHLGGHAFNISATFSPRVSGSYVIGFSSEFTDAMSSAFIFNITCFRFEETNWRNKTLWKGKWLSLNFTICASSLSQKDELNIRVVQLTERGLPAKNITTRFELEAHDDGNQYIVRLKANLLDSGIYRVTALVGRKELKSPSFGVEIKTELDLKGILIGIIVPVTIVILIVIGFCIWYHKRYFRIKVSLYDNGKPRNLTMPRTQCNTLHDLLTTIKSEAPADDAAAMPLIEQTSVYEKMGVKNSGKAIQWFDVGDNDRTKRLREFHIISGSHIIMKKFSQDLKVGLVESDSSRKMTKIPIQLEITDSSWGDVLKKKKLEGIDKNSVAFQFGYFYGKSSEGEHFAVEVDGEKYVDENDGTEICDENRWIYRNFLKADTKLKRAPEHCSWVYVRRECDLLALRSDNSFETLTVDDIFDGKWLAFIRGVRQNSTGIQDGEVYIELEEILVQVHGSKHHIVEDDYRNFYLFFRNDGVIPKLKLFEKNATYHHNMLFYRRIGIEMKLDDGRLKQTETNNVDFSKCEWKRPMTADELELDFFAYFSYEDENQQK